jgi:hypothetical protein
MRWVDRMAWSGLLIAAATTAHAQSEYNRVDTFEPGKKYNCIPTADRKGWDCKELGKASASDASPKEKPVATTTPVADSAPAPVSSPAPEKPLPPMATQMTEKPSALPSYLRAAPAAASVPTAVAAPTAPAPSSTPAPPPAPTNVEPPRDVAAKPATVAAPTPIPAPTNTQASPPEAIAAPRVPTAPAPNKETATTSSANGNREFLTLPASSYVIELAHGASRADINALRDSLQLPRGDLYELHLSRDGGDWWMLAWGSFDSISAARTARGELATNAAINAGWPRLVAPLQNEARRRSEQ